MYISCTTWYETANPWKKSTVAISTMMQCPTCQAHLEVCTLETMPLPGYSWEHIAANIGKWKGSNPLLVLMVSLVVCNSFESLAWCTVSATIHYLLLIAVASVSLASTFGMWCTPPRFYVCKASNWSWSLVIRDAMVWIRWTRKFSVHFNPVHTFGLQSKW